MIIRHENAAIERRKQYDEWYTHEYTWIHKLKKNQRYRSPPSLCHVIKTYLTQTELTVWKTW